MRKVTRSCYSLYVFLGIKDRIYHPKFWYNIFSSSSFPVAEYYRNSKIFSTLLMWCSGTMLQWAFFVLFDVWKMNTSSVHCCLGEPGSIHLIGWWEMVGGLAGVTPCQSNQATEGTSNLLKEHGWHDSFGNCSGVVEIRLEITCASLQKLLVLEEITDTSSHKKKRMIPLRPEIYLVKLFIHKILQGGSSSTSSSRQSHLCNQTMLLRALTCQAIKNLWVKNLLFSVLMVKKFLFIICLLCISLCPLPLSRNQFSIVKSLDPSSWYPSHRFWGKVIRSPQNLFFSRLNRASIFSDSSQGTCHRILEIISAYSDSG